MTDRKRLTSIFRDQRIGELREAISNCEAQREKVRKGGGFFQIDYELSKAELGRLCVQYLPALLGELEGSSDD